MTSSFCASRLAVLVCALPVVGIVAHTRWGQAHPGQNATHVRRLDLPAEPVFNDRFLVQHILVLPPDLPTWPRAEVIRVAIVRERITAHGVLRVIGGSRGPDWKMAQIA